MRTLDRYVFREALAPFVLALLVLTFILIIPFIIDQAETLIAKGVSWPTIARIMGTLLPSALGLTIPMSALVALLVALGRFSGDREVIALMACGISPLRLLRPALAVGILTWAATSWVMLEAIPDANQTFREIRDRLVADRAEGEVRPREFFEDFPNLVLYVQDIPAEGGWTGVTAADTRDPNHPVLYMAARGRMLVDREKRAIQMRLLDGSRHSTSADDPEAYQVETFAETILSLDPETVFPRVGPPRGEREMTIPQLRERAADLVASGQSPHNPLMEIHKKFSIPAACLIFALIAVALGATDRRDGKLVPFAFGVGVIFAYYALLWLGQSLAMGQYLSPAWAMWLPNVVLGLVGAGLLWRRTRGARRSREWTLPHVAFTRPGRRSAGRSVVSRIPELTELRPSILDLYVATLYLRVLGLALVGMAGLFYISSFIDLSDKLVKGTTSLGMFVEYLWWSTPQFMYYIIALAVLLAAVVTIGALTKSSELVVMRACGISLYRTAVPLLAAAAFASVGLYGIEEMVLAPANRRANELSYLIRGQQPKSATALNRKWLTGTDGALYHYSFYDPRERQIDGLTVLRFDGGDGGRVTTRTFAATAGILADADPATRTWLGRKGWVRAFDEKSDVREYATFDETNLELEPPEAFVTQAPRPDEMNYPQLKAYLENLRARGRNVRDGEVALHRKIAFPFVTLVMTLIGVPFAVTTGRRGALYGVGVGIVLALVYWTMISVFAAFGAGGALPPMLAAWAPNLIFGACATYLLLTVRT